MEALSSERVLRVSCGANHTACVTGKVEIFLKLTYTICKICEKRGLFGPGAGAAPSGDSVSEVWVMGIKIQFHCLILYIFMFFFIYESKLLFERICL